MLFILNYISQWKECCMKIIPQAVSRTTGSNIGSVAAPGGARGANAPQNFVAPQFPPNFLWNQEKMSQSSVKSWKNGHFPTKWLKTITFWGSCLPEGVKSKDFLEVFPPDKCLAPQKILMLAQPLHRFVCTHFDTCSNADSILCQVANNI